MWIWLVVGLIVWVLCLLFMLAIIKGGHRVRGHERKDNSSHRPSVVIRKLSESCKFNKYAKCKNCKEIFIDDIPVIGSVECPNCKGLALHRGLNVI